MSSVLLLLGALFPLSAAAANSYALITTDSGTGCNAKPCIALSSDGVLNNTNHGLFVKNLSPSPHCTSYNGASGATAVELDAAMTTPTLISSLTFNISAGTPGSSLCATGADTWHIFKSSNDTIWSVKLNASSTFPTTLDSTNFKECQPSWNFDTTNGCVALLSPVSASIGLSFNNQPEIFATEIDLK